MVLRAALVALLLAVATGWIAYDQSDPAVCLVALTVAFTAWLTFTTLMVLELAKDVEEATLPTADAPQEAGEPERWNGTGTPRVMDDHSQSRGFQRLQLSEKEGPVRC